MTFTFRCELPLHSGGQQTPLLYSSVCEGISLATSSAAPNVPHNATQRPPLWGHIVSASDPAPVSRFPGPFAVNSYGARHSFHAISAAQAECLEHHRLSKTVLDVMHVPEVCIFVNREVPYTGHRSTYPRGGPLLNRRGCVEEDIGPLSQNILRDADSLLSTAPNVLDESPLYNTDWTELDMNDFIHIVMYESEITCQWAACGDRLKIKEIRSHLVLDHGIKSSPKPYYCFWNGCSGGRMTELSSLVRHIREYHGSAYKYWPCLSCEKIFTREETSLSHWKKCAGRRKPRVAHQGLVTSGQGFA